MYKINLFLLFLNYLIVVIIMFLISIFAKKDLEISLYCSLITGAFCVVHFACTKFLYSFTLDENNRKVSLNFKRFLFYNKNLLFSADDLSFSYKKEVGPRGSKSLVFTLYTLDKEKIIRLFAMSSGFSENVILEMVLGCREMDIKEVL